MGAATIDADALRSWAEAETGLSDLGGTEAERGFARLVAAVSMVPATAVDDDVRLDRLRRLLVGRLEFVEDESRYAGIRTERIDAPVFVMGLARSGTTLLQSLLAQDPASRSPLIWEAMLPSPPPSLVAPNDPRLLVADEQHRNAVRANPGMLQARPYLEAGAFALAECRAIWASGAFLDGFLANDANAAYRFHRRFLQHLQFGAPARRWVLKDGTHYCFIPQILASYPDANLVWIHRDPVRVIASECRMKSVIAESASARTDPGEIARKVIRSARTNLDAALSSHFVDHPSVCHLRYADLVDDPVATTHRIYEHFGLSVDPEFEGRIRHWTTNPGNARDRHGSFDYSLERLGVAPKQIDELFADYRERFGIPYER